MKRLSLCIIILLLIFSLCACGKGNNQQASASGGKASVDWKKIYLEELLAAQEYAAAMTWEDYDPDSRYPLNLYNAQLADLNFDGIPELFIFDTGAEASQEVRIFTINANRELKKVSE